MKLAVTIAVLTGLTEMKKHSGHLLGLETESIYVPQDMSEVGYPKFTFIC